MKVKFLNIKGFLGNGICVCSFSSFVNDQQIHVAKSIKSREIIKKLYTFKKEHIP